MSLITRLVCRHVYVANCSHPGGSLTKTGLRLKEADGDVPVYA